MLKDSTSILYLTNKRFFNVKIQHCSFLLNEEEHIGFFFKSVTPETLSYHYTSNSIKAIF